MERATPVMSEPSPWPSPAATALALRGDDDESAAANSAAAREDVATPPPQWFVPSVAPMITTRPSQAHARTVDSQKGDEEERDGAEESTADGGDK
jgi:hypothetical protein